MNKLGSRQLRGEALRERVLYTALRLFSEHGYFNTSLQDIRRVAEVSIGAIYHHFENKEQLAKQLFDRLLSDMNHAMEDATHNHDDCLGKCRAIIKKLYQLTESEPGMMQFILLAQHREFLPEEAPICSSEPFQFMKRAVEQGMAEGDVRPMDAWVAATAMFGGALRMMNLQLDGALDRPLQSYFDESVECAWRAIKA